MSETSEAAAGGPGQPAGTGYTVNPNVPDLPKGSFGPHFEMHPIVFPAGALIVLALVALTFVQPLVYPDGDLQELFNGAKDWIGARFGWLYVASLSAFLAFALWLALSRLGSVKLGRDEEKPEFNRLTWFAMLFSAGMGIGLVFWSVAEPIYHLQHLPARIRRRGSTALASRWR